MQNRKKYFFIFGALTLFYFFCLNVSTRQREKIALPKKQVVLVKKTVKPLKKSASGYRYRKYSHVAKLYQRLALPVTELCIKHKVPPGAVLSIISLESGWGQGYIGRITGNFLSLNAFGNDAELPALRMPKDTTTHTTILDKRKLAKIPKTNIVWENRPPSLKKDYRPDSIAGTTTNLSFLINHPNEMTKANLKNVEDFVSRFISHRSSIKAYNEARTLLDEQVAVHGIEILFDAELNKKFIYTIGGRPNSFNFRETWPKKVMNIFNNTGVNKLTKDLYLNKKTFEEAW
ncbi:hypothetical protein AXE80_14145 [Wenyingzhuangia fucanilytica]|uniref:Uncharacterized protein n=1 Tax=Wenyingzhuangia fucanilytica TaxID=1790137 RepID=A0A1B1Y9D9_9FLAO|nr:glucosaminidase domain-containing protein [Wenyingzhuangia fucanilytica]ANW97366.1 hypothetical protein AXE80_14145 [Wenyingzhuangia fucanilytica]